MRRLAMLAACLVGCGSEEGIRACFDPADIELACEDDPDCADTLEVTVALSDHGDFCEPATITTSAVLPWCVAISPGDRYADSTAIRADVLAAGRLVARREVAIDFEAGTIVERHLVLDGTCFQEGACAVDEQCISDTCEPVPFGTRVFDGDRTDVVVGDLCEASSGS